MVTVRNGHPQGCPFHFSVRSCGCRAGVLAAKFGAN